MRLRNALLVCLALLAAPTPTSANATDAATFSLREALRLMRAAHPLLVAAGHEITATQYDVIATKLWRNPNFYFNYLKGVTHSSYDPTGYRWYGVEQFFEVANAPGARKRAATRLVSASKFDRASLDVQLSLDVESAMIDVAASQRAAALLQRAVDLLEGVGRIVTERVAGGAAPRYDAARIAVTLATIHADLAEMQAGLARAWGELRAAVGPRASELHGDADYDIEEAPELPTAEDLLEFLATSRPDLVAARERAASAQIQISAAKRSVLPGLNLGLQGGFGAAPRQHDVGFTMSVPLPLVDRGQGIIPAARARSHEAESMVGAVLVPAAARIMGMHQEVAIRREALAQYKARGVTSGDEMLIEAQAGYVAGRFSVLELADAFRAWREARMREIDLAAAARQAEVDLGRELGRPLRELR